MSALVHTTVHVHTYVVVTHKRLARGYHYYSHLHNNALLEGKVVVLSHLRVLPHSYESACLGLFLVLCICVPAGKRGHSGV